MTKPTLTPKQARFVEEYLIDLNASAAARRAGYSDRRADQQGLENLRKPEISAAIAQQRQMVSERTARTVADVMSDLAAVRRNAMELVDDLHTGTKTMRSHRDAIRALELEGRHLGAFDERMRLMGHDGGPMDRITRIEIVSEPLRRPESGEWTDTADAAPADAGG